MKVGDLVMIRNCVQQGVMGIISLVPKHDGQYPPGCWLYWVIFGNEEKCFTGNQLVWCNE